MKSRYALKCLCGLIAFCIVLSGCSFGSRKKTEPIRIELWSYYIGEQKKALDDLVNDFNTTVGFDNNVVLESVSKSDTQELSRQLYESMLNEPGAEKLPDLFFAYPDVAYMLAQEDMLINFKDYAKSKELNKYVPGFLAEGDLFGDGRIFILPAAKSTELLVLNQTYFDEFCAAIDGNSAYPEVSNENFATWEGILEAADAYYTWSMAEKPGVDGNGRALFGIDSIANYLYTGCCQLDSNLVMSESGTGIVDFSGDAFETVWNTYYVPTIKGQFAAYGRFRSDDLRTGDILAYLGSSSSAAYLSNEIVDDQGNSINVEITTLPVPQFAAGRPVAVQQGAGIAVVKSNKEQEKASVLFATWFSETERNSEFSIQSSYMPVRSEAVSLLAAEDIQDQTLVRKALQVALTQVDSGYDLYTTPVYENAYLVRDVLVDNLRESAELSHQAIVTDVEAGADYGETVSKIDSRKAMLEYIDQCEKALENKGITIKKP